MDELGGFEPTDTTGFIQIESIRIKKFVFFSHLLSFTHPQPGLDGHKQMFGRIKLV